MPTSRSTRERNGWILLATKIKARTAEGRWIKNPVWPSSCVTPAGTSNELDVQNGWEENTHTHRASEDQGRSSLRSRCTVNNVEFIVIEVAIRYTPYTIYSVYSFNRDDAECVKRYKAWKEKVFRRGEEDDQPGRYLMIIISWLRSLDIRTNKKD